MTDDLEPDLVADEVVARIERVPPPGDDQLRSGNPALAPRHARCRLCNEVSALEDVAFRLYDEKGRHLPTKPLHAYLRSIGIAAATPQSLYNRIKRHRDHIDAWLERGARVVPARLDDHTQRIPAVSGPVRWLDAQQNAIDLGDSAVDILKSRLDLMDDKNLIAVAKLGATAATARGNLEAKGKALSQVDKLLQLAAGMPS